jgi:hypothetical protein
LAVHNEGEKTFLRILEAFPSRDLKDIEGISFLEADGSFVHSPLGQDFETLTRFHRRFWTAHLIP